MTTRTLGRILMMVALSGGLSSSLIGCDAINKLKGEKKAAKKSSSDDESEESDKDKDKADTSASASASAAPTASATASATAEPTAAPSASTPAPATDDVKHYPEEVAASGTFVTKKSFTVYDAADTSSKELGHLAPGTLINLKATYSNWMLIEWPSGIGELSPGWVQVKRNDTTIQQTTEKIDAGKPVVDAGAPAVVDAGPAPVVDAGKPVTVDAGTKGRIPILHLPTHK